MQRNWRRLGGSAVKLGAVKTKGEKRGGKGLHDAGRALNCQARKQGT